MSKIALEGNASGTGTFTIASPNSNSNYTLTLPTSTGTVVVTGGAQTIEFAAGSAASPSITFTGDTNTGIFSPGADTIAFSEGGVEAMRIDSSGNVGIGTSSPVAAVQLQRGASTAAYYAVASNNAALGTSGLLLGQDATGLSRIYQYGANAITLWTNDTERMRITSAGLVGINQSSPGTFLDVSHSSVSYAEGLFLTNTANWGYGNSITFRAVLTDGGSVGNAARIQQSYESSNNYNLIFSTTGSGTLTERARITSGGYFKASNNGTYINSTGAYHEFYQTADGSVLWGTGYNNSYTNAVIATQVQRSANAAYSFFDGYSGLSDLEFRLYGDGNGRCDGAWTGGGADYAEYFESANGQALTLGATVVLDGNKVREATSQDPASAIIGVVRPKEPSKASAMIGNAAWNKWAKKYLTDDFDRYIMEDHNVVEWEETITDEEGKTSTKQHSYESHNIPAGVTVPADAVRKTHDDKGNKFQHYKLNPAWDKDAEYVNRENRPEWNIIGLLGQVKILKGQPVGDRWIKMRDVSATVEEWMIR